MHQTHHRQAVNGFDRVDGMPASDWDACACAGILAAAQDGADGGQRQGVDGHAHQSQCHDGSPPHGVDVGDGVGGGDVAEVMRVVDDGHEKIGRGNQGLLVIQPIHRGVVRGFNAHQQLLGCGEQRALLQDGTEHAGCDLAAAAATVGERGEAQHGVSVVRCSHGVWLRMRGQDGVEERVARHVSRAVMVCRRGMPQ